MKLLYFAWMRTTIGTAEEELVLPAEIKTVSDLLDWLPSRGPAFEEALSRRELLRVAVNQEYADLDQPVTDSDEVALFPPVTGG